MIEGVKADLWRRDSRLREDRDFDLLPELFELVHSGGALDVGGNQERLALVLVLDEEGKLPAGGGFPASLKACHQDHRGVPRLVVDSRINGSHQPRHFLIDDVDELLTGVHALQDLLSQSFDLHPGEEILHHVKRHVGLKERDPDFPQRFANVALGDLFPRNSPNDVAEAAGDGLKHEAWTLFFGQKLKLAAKFRGEPTKAE